MNLECENIIQLWDKKFDKNLCMFLSLHVCSVVKVRNCDHETGSSLYCTVLYYRSRQIAAFAAPNKRQPSDRQLATAKRQPPDRQLVFLQWASIK